MTAIRKGTRKDVEVFEHLVSRLHAHMQGATSDPFLVGTEHSWLAGWQTWFDTQAHRSQGAVFLAEEAGVVIGFVAGEMRAPFLPSPKLSKIGFLSLCWVEPEHRRRGIGRRLVASIEDWFKEKGAGYIEVEYRLQGSGSEAVWRALGYVPYRAVARKVR
jgi:GNAT superfamily N-acetyltransferase